MKKWLLCGLLCINTLLSFAQQYLVFFNSKSPGNHSFSNAAEYLSPRAIERRERYSISLDSTDLPVPATFIHQLQQVPGVQVLNVSKWLNAASVQVSNAAAIEAINRLPFVRGQKKVTNSVRPDRGIFKKTLGRARKFLVNEEPPIGYGLSEGQVKMHHGQFLHRLGLRGEGMQLGVLDAGFNRYLTLPAFDSVRMAGRIVETWDFVARDTSVAEDDAHGMQCFSIIAGNIPGQFVGTAPYASFYLYRSENAASETIIEEFNWVCAAERLDSAGGDIISSSLGYNEFDQAANNHTYADMNGNTSLVVTGADLAAKKGILVVSAVGNSGNDRWKYLVTPSDGDSVLAVGAVDRNGQPASFSGYGPSADGRIKPDVVSMGAGTYFQATNGRIGSGNGTSYATPNMAGLAACLWQGFPQASNMQIIEALRQSGIHVQVPNERVGYGIPDMRKAMGILLKQFARTEISLQGCKANLTWESSDGNSMYYEIERQQPGSGEFVKLATVQSKATVWGKYSYQFTDNIYGTEAGQVQYRILQVLDTTGSASYAVYLDTLSIQLSPSCASNQRFSIAPNPVQAGAILQARFEESIAQLNLVVRNALGQQVLIYRTTKAAGAQNISFNTAALASGTYYLQVYDGEKLLTTLEFIRL